MFLIEGGSTSSFIVLILVCVSISTGKVDLGERRITFNGNVIPLQTSFGEYLRWLIIMEMLSPSVKINWFIFQVGH